jgi:hypothetical protein
VKKIAKKIKTGSLRSQSGASAKGPCNLHVG